MWRTEHGFLWLVFSILWHDEIILRNEMNYNYLEQDIYLDAHSSLRHL